MSFAFSVFCKQMELYQPNFYCVQISIDLSLEKNVWKDGLCMLCIIMFAGLRCFIATVRVWLHHGELMIWLHHGDLIWLHHGELMIWLHHGELAVWLQLSDLVTSMWSQCFCMQLPWYLNLTRQKDSCSHTSSYTSPTSCVLRGWQSRYFLLSCTVTYLVSKKLHTGWWAWSYHCWAASYS